MANDKQDAEDDDSVVEDGVIVELTICNDEVNTSAVAYDADGEVIEVPARIEVRPQFLAPNGLVGISRCRVKAAQNNSVRVQSSSMLRVSGVNGKMVVEPIRSQMLPKFMLGGEKAEKPKKAEKVEPPKTP